ncbi:MULTISPECIES: hypothetical protein [unclassified Cryobacterium]|uniref:hypothetical protein n=1 Tax=unclassified Cryobacterium TaxID=2649013 RepID=UPI00106B7C83|nr:MULTISPECIES: hypothetical protein [unclassified Cryobacterium]TFB96268.1 hypothetical protein E3O39_09180 [Cryobacterium sp. MDB2-A-1]TFC12553.1 hypothetical protein E3O35_06345 [Cryobacterium sp. MDB2-A-2]
MERYKIDRVTSMPWVEVAHSARIMRDVLDSVGAPLPGSAFAQVDRLYPWEPASEWARDYLSAGLEHLEFWADATAPMKFHPDAIVVHRLRPVQALARAAVESASQSVWMMDATDARSTALRHLNLVLDDINEERKALPLEEKQRMTDRRAQLLARVANGTNEKEIGQFKGYMDVVKKASAAAAKHGNKQGGILIQLRWSGCGGLPLGLHTASAGRWSH